jgi:hypothetical protein
MIATGAALLAVLSGCSTYQYAKNVKLVSFDDDVTKGKSVGPIRGEDCIWTILGYRLGGHPTLDKAFANARNQADSSLFGGSTQSASSDKAIRYINNVSTENDGFNAVVVAKECLVVKGTGYR